MTGVRQLSAAWRGTLGIPVLSNAPNHVTTNVTKEQNHPMDACSSVGKAEEHKRLFFLLFFFLKTKDQTGVGHKKEAEESLIQLLKVSRNRLRGKFS